jgi:hypothetical protein
MKYEGVRMARLDAELKPGDKRLVWPETGPAVDLKKDKEGKKI